MINLRIFNYLKNIIEQFLNYREICTCGPNYTPKMVKKAAERSLIKFFDSSSFEPQLVSKLILTITKIFNYFCWVEFTVLPLC